MAGKMVGSVRSLCVCVLCYGSFGCDCMCERAHTYCLCVCVCVWCVRAICARSKLLLFVRCSATCKHPVESNWRWIRMKDEVRCCHSWAPDSKRATPDACVHDLHIHTYTHANIAYIRMQTHCYWGICASAFQNALLFSSVVMLCSNQSVVDCRWAQNVLQENLNHIWFWITCFNSVIVNFGQSGQRWTIYAKTRINKDYVVQ